MHEWLSSYMQNKLIMFCAFMFGIGLGVVLVKLHVLQSVYAWLTFVGIIPTF